MVDSMTLAKEMQATVDRYAMQVEDAKAELKARQELLKQSEKRLTAYIRIGDAALKDQKSFIDDIEAADAAKSNGKAAKEKKPSKKAANDAAIQAAAAEPTDTSWKKRPVGDAITLGSVKNQLESQEPSVTTLGEVERWLQKHSFETLPGVGPEKAAKAADQYAEFFRAHPEYKR